MSLPAGPYSGPPPICFNCSKEGHFVVDCPEPQRTSTSGPPVALPSNSSNDSFQGSQAPQWPNSRSTGAPGATVTHFPKPPPVVTRYAVPGQPPPYGDSPGSYGPSPTAAPFQHPGSTTPAQSYPQQQGSYTPQKYNVSAPPYSHNPLPQSQNSPLPNSLYGQGYQAPPHSSYPPLNDPPQYNGASPQQYGPPSTAQYQSPVNQYSPRNGSYSAPPPPQWNNTTPVSASPPFGPPSHQQPSPHRGISSIQREFSGTPSKQAVQSSQQQTSQNGNSRIFDGYQQAPRTLASTYIPNAPSQSPQTSPVNGSYFPRQDPPESATPSVASSRASTPYGKYGAVRSGSFSSNSEKQKSPLVTAKSRSATSNVHNPEPISFAEEDVLKEVANEEPKKDAKDAEEGEYTEEDLLQEQFNWAYKKIFKEPEATESVALSQPLSYTYNVTPVPLMDSRWNNSVSRYARKDNLKEYLRPIRSQSQWDYLKEDPAFSDIPLEGPLIPLREVRSWMEKRQGIQEGAEAAEEAPEQPSESSRKRAWSDEQEDVDKQIQPEVSIEQNEQNPSKRQKNEQIAEKDCIVVEASGTPAPGTPIVETASTPTFGVVDDAWAPEPDEAASTPINSTEALLASLGVSGAPKPVREQSNPIGADDNYGNSSFGKIPHSMSPQAHPVGNNATHSNANPNMPLHGSQDGAPQGNSGYDKPRYNTPQQGRPSNGNTYGPPQSNVPYSNHGLPVYNDNAPLQPTPTSYGPPQQYGAPYYNPPTPQRHFSHGDNQYGPPQGQYSPQGQYGPPQNQYPPQGQYGPPQPQYSGPPQGQWGPSQGQYNGPPQNQWGPPQYGPSQQYNVLPQVQYGPSQSQYGPSQGHYGPPQQYGPQGQWGPSQGQYTSGYPPGPPNQGSDSQYGNPGYGPPQGQSPQDNGYSNVPQQDNPRQFNNQGDQPFRQDSGYASARGSYSNSSKSNGFTKGPPQQSQQQVNGTRLASNPGVDGGNDTPPETMNPEIKVDTGEPKEPEPVESPLSPTSAEILGKLTQPNKPRKIIRVISGKNKAQADDSPTKKAKRPAPVVAEAYSRRW